MRELIKWNLQLALKAWQEPDDYGRSYELRTRDKRVVKILRLDQNNPFPILGQMRCFWDKRKLETRRWTNEGSFLGQNNPSNLDLELYIVFRYPGVPIPDDVHLSRLSPPQFPRFS